MNLAAEIVMSTIIILLSALLSQQHVKPLHNTIFHSVSLAVCFMNPLF